MKIYMLPAFTSNSANVYNKTENNKTSNPYKTNSLKTDTISFSGKKVPNELLDRYLGHLLEMGNVKKEEHTAITLVKEIFDESREKINSQIQPYLIHNEFLWKITPETRRRSFSEFVDRTVRNSGYDPKAKEEAWESVFTKIKERILSGNPQDMLDELKKAEPSIRPQYKNKLNLLRNLLAKKLEVNLQEQQQISTTSSKLFDKILSVKEKLEWIKYEANYQAGTVINDKTFKRELVQRATEKRPDLKKIYSEAYKRAYDNFKLINYKKGLRSQKASEYANQAIHDYLAEFHG